MLKECSKMHAFEHKHVVTLRGVCLDGGPAPYIIMPFMANGSLLAYLKKSRETLIVSSKEQDEVNTSLICCSYSHFKIIISNQSSCINLILHLDGQCV